MSTPGRELSHEPESTSERISVGMLPGRRRPCLFVDRPGSSTILASFKSDAAMREFLSFEPTFQPKRLQ